MLFVYRALLAFPAPALPLLVATFGPRAVPLVGPRGGPFVDERPRVMPQERQARRGAEHQQVDQAERHRSEHRPDADVAAHVDEVAIPHERDHGDRRDR